MHGIIVLKRFPTATPGSLCTVNDEYFKEIEYGIVKCNRHVTQKQKERVATYYKFPRWAWETVEFDHLIPLGIGGSNNDDNLWPQPGPTGYGEAHEKDLVEMQAYKLLRYQNGTQAEAAQLICDWLNNQYNPIVYYNISSWGL